MRLSKSFKLEEFLRSQTAERNGIDMEPDDEVIENLQTLVDTCLQPLRDSLGSVIYISSGYRPRILNTLIGGSLKSAHMTGSAADFIAVGYTPLEVCSRVVELELPIDQIINEFAKWSHLGISDSPRGQKLTAYRRKGKTRYALGLSVVSELMA